MVVGRLYAATQQEQYHYLGQRWRLPLRPLWTQTQEDYLFTALSWDIPNTPPIKRRRNEWIPAETWCLDDMRVAA